MKKRVFFGFDQNCGPQNFTFASENGQTSEPLEKVKQNVPWDVANNRYYDCFIFKKKYFKINKEKPH